MKYEYSLVVPPLKFLLYSQVFAVLSDIYSLPRFYRILPHSTAFLLDSFSQHNVL